MLKPIQSRTAIALLAGLLSALCVLGLRGVGFLEPLELTVYDWLIQVRSLEQGLDSRIVILAITEQDIRNQGRWPITDSTLAEVLNQLVQAGPRAIGLDIYRDIEVPPGREKLNAILISNPHIVSVTKLGGEESAHIPPPPVHAHMEQVGFSDLLPDMDGIVRRAILFQDHGEEVAEAFGLKLALLYLEEQGVYPEPDSKNSQYLRLGPTTLRRFKASDGGYAGADAGGYQILLNLQGRNAAQQLFSLSSLLSGEINREVLQDKVVLVGVMAESVPDLLHTAYGMTHGVEIHAHIISQLLGAGIEGRGPIRTLTDLQEGAWVVAWGLAGGFFGLWARSAWRFVVGAVVLLSLLVCVAVFLIFQGLWIPSAPPGMAWFLSAAVVTAAVVQQERRDRTILRQLFGQHVSDEVAEALWREREQFLRGGRPRSQLLIATVLFADFKGYTSASEKMDPQEVMNWLNSYLEVMTRLVMSHHGFVDDYAGDAIKANFYNPLKGISGEQESQAEVANDAVNAVTCALAMEREMHRLNRLHEQVGLPTVGMRIGIYTGPVVAGSVGSTQRMKYTTVGDSVNTAARLESLDRDTVTEIPGQRPCRILIGDTTLDYLGSRFAVQRIGEVNLRGKDKPFASYQVLGYSEQETDRD